MLGRVRADELWVRERRHVVPGDHGLVDALAQRDVAHRRERREAVDEPAADGVRQQPAGPRGLEALRAEQSLNDAAEPGDALLEEGDLLA